jgi:hypothetical protein
MKRKVARCVRILPTTLYIEGGGKRERFFFVQMTVKPRILPLSLLLQAAAHAVDKRLIRKTGIDSNLSSLGLLFPSAIQRRR